MAGRYGMSFAAKMIQEGKYAEAIEEATRAVARDDEDPAPLVERASAYAWLERYSEAVQDLEAAMALDETAGVLEIDVVDDAYFSALLGAAKLEARTSLDAANANLGALRDRASGRAPPGRRCGVARPLANGGAAERDARSQKSTAGCLARRRLRESRRANVLAVARRIFSEKGYHATSIHHIIEAADIARGTFYLYFESKRAIFDELLDSLVTTLQAQVRRIEVGSEAPPPSIR